MTEDELKKQFDQEFDSMMHSGLKIGFNLSITEAWIVLSQLQFALRHPANRGPSAVIAKGIAMMLQAKVAVLPAMKKVAEQGWDREHDQKTGLIVRPSKI